MDDLLFLEYSVDYSKMVRYSLN